VRSSCFLDAANRKRPRNVIPKIGHRDRRCRKPTRVGARLNCPGSIVLVQVPRPNDRAAINRPQSRSVRRSRLSCVGSARLVWILRQGACRNRARGEGGLVVQCSGVVSLFFGISGNRNILTLAYDRPEPQWTARVATLRTCTCGDDLVWRTVRAARSEPFDDTRPACARHQFPVMRLMVAFS
jgi:hypothetical protein